MYRSIPNVYPPCLPAIFLASNRVPNNYMERVTGSVDSLNTQDFKHSFEGEVVTFFDRHSAGLHLPAVHCQIFLPVPTADKRIQRDILDEPWCTLGPVRSALAPRESTKVCKVLKKGGRGRITRDYGLFPGSELGRCLCYTEKGGLAG